jgi:rhomboid protease GluP
LLFFAIVVVVTGAHMISSPRPGRSDVAFGIVAVGFFGLASLVLLGRLIRSGRATAILTNEGVTFPSAFDGVLPWGAVRSFEYVTRYKNRVLHVTPYADTADEMCWKGLARWAFALRGNKAVARFSIPLNTSPEVETRFLDYFAARVRAAKALRPEDSPLGRIDAQDAELSARRQAQEAQSEAAAIFPYVTAGLTALLLAIFIAELGGPTWSNIGAGSRSVQTLVQFGGVFRVAVERGEWWRVFSAPLLHASFAHLLLNCASLWIVGVRFERYVGSGWFAAVFAGSAIAGSLMSLALNPANLVSVGASCGIVGLFAATALASRHFPPGRMRTLMMRTAAETLLPSLVPIASGPGGVAIDYAGHFGGALGGGALGFAILALWPRELTRPRYGRAAAIGAGLCGLIGVGAVAINASAFIYPKRAAPSALPNPESRAQQKSRPVYRLPDPMAERAPVAAPAPRAPTGNRIGGSNSPSP